MPAPACRQERAPPERQRLSIGFFFAYSPLWELTIRELCPTVGSRKHIESKRNNQMRNVSSLLILSFLLLSGSGFAVRPGDFQVEGPGGGGAMFNPTISPHDPNTVLISCDMTGSYITHDGGQSWRMFNLRGVVRFFVFDPLDAKVIYAQATGLWRSTDGGETWELVYPPPASIKSVVMRSDHADEELEADPDPMGRDPADRARPRRLAVRHAQRPAVLPAHGRDSSRGARAGRAVGRRVRRPAALSAARRGPGVLSASSPRAGRRSGRRRCQRKPFRCRRRTCASIPCG